MEGASKEHLKTSPDRYDDPCRPIASDAGPIGKRPKFISAPEAAEQSNLTRIQIQKMCAAGVLTSMKVAERWLILSDLTPIVEADQWMLNAVEESNPSDILCGKDVWQLSLAVQGLPSTSRYSWVYKYNQFVARFMRLHHLPSPSVLWRDGKHIKGWRGWTISEFCR